MVYESTKLERLRVIRDADFVDRFERANATVTFTPYVAEGVALQESAAASVTFTPAVDEDTLDQALSAVIDDFEDAGITEYTGDTGGATVITSTALEGTYSLQMSEGDNLIISTSGLPDYPTPGDIFRTNHNIQSGAIAEFGYGVQDASNMYLVRLDADTGTFSLVKVVGGSETVLDTASQSFDTNATIEVKVEWRTDGDHLVSYIDSLDNVQATLTAEDVAYTDGGIAWGENSTAATPQFADYYLWQNNTTKVDAWDVSGSSWSQPNPTVPKDFTNGWCVGVGSKGYVTGDNSESATTYEYDPGTNSFTQVTSKPTGVQDPRGASVDGVAYFMGGIDGSFNDLDVHESYDPDSDTWSTSPTALPSGNSSMAVCTDGSVIYVFGGRGSNAAWSYDPGADSWDTSLTAAPTAIDRADATFYDGKIYVPGNSTDGTQLQIYDVATDSWSTGTSQPVARIRSHTFTGEDGLIYDAKGQDQSNSFASLDDIGQYDPGADSWATLASGSFGGGNIVGFGV